MLTHVGILYSTFSTFHSGNHFLAGGSADTLNKSCHKPGQEAQLPNPMSISLGNPWMPKCTAQLHSLNLVNRMCLSKSDFDVQSVGYKSAQSPTNWESFHGKVPSILCWLSPSLSIALDDSCITQNVKSKIMDIRNLYESSCYKMSLKKTKNLLPTQLQCLRGQGPCKTAWNLRCSRLISMYVWISGASDGVNTKWL